MVATRRAATSRFPVMAGVVDGSEPCGGPMTPRASSFLLLVPAGLLLTTIVTAPASVRAQWQGSWSPDDYGDIPKFEQAVACYDEVHDEYVIAAVFQGMIAYGGLLRDQLHVLRIGGNASSPDYGEVVDALYVE